MLLKLQGSLEVEMLMMTVKLDVDERREGRNERFIVLSLQWQVLSMSVSVEGNVVNE